MAQFQLGGMELPRRVDVLKNIFRCEEYRLVPLVTEELNLLCSVDILMLRPDKPGSLIRSGDIDNRLKTLFDALRIPKNGTERGGALPLNGEEPLYCLLEDDRLINKVSVSADVLLQAPKQSDQQKMSPDDVRLLITVNLRPINLGWGNIDFA